MPSSSVEIVTHSSSSCSATTGAGFCADVLILTAKLLAAGLMTDLVTNQMALLPSAAGLTTAVLDIILVGLVNMIACGIPL